MEFYETKAVEYREMEHNAIAEWAEGQAEAYRNILKSYGSPVA
jgi:hypothetical protein